MNSLRLLPFLLLATFTTSAQRVQLVRKDAEKRVDVVVDGQPFTSYIYPGPAVLKKAVLYPIRTASGQFITRGWPMDPRPGERVDHPHHVGMWFNYGDVNGHDFWNNSTDVDPSHKGPMGTVVHTGIKELRSGNDAGELTVTADWLDKDGKPMLREQTTYRFAGKPNERIIDRITTLRAPDKDVLFKDNKEGLVALRMARQFEHPSRTAEVFTDASGKPTNVAKMDNAGVTGHYESSEGLTGDAVWGTRAKWVNLSGVLNGENVTVALLDHPQNVGYPTYWHARGYGLFSANPLAPAVFTNGKAPALNYTLHAGQTVTFRHRLIITSGATPNTAGAFDAWVK